MIWIGQLETYFVLLSTLNLPAQTHIIPPTVIWSTRIAGYTWARAHWIQAIGCLCGLHSFIGGIEGQNQRSCDIESPWVLVQEKWEPAVVATTRASVKSAAEVVAGVHGGRFFLRTEANSETTKEVGASEHRLPNVERKPPLDLPVPMGGGEMGRRKFRILAYNIKHGRGNDNQVDLTRTAEVIRRLHPDFVALQEVDQQVQRSGGIDQARELASLTGVAASRIRFFL